MNKTVKSAVALTEKVLQEQVERLNATSKIKWVVQSEPYRHLSVDYKFQNFAKTWKFLNTIVVPAHKLRHHPTITTTYNKVNIELTTHDSDNNITLKDLRLALLISDIYDSQATDSDSTTRKEISLSEATKIINELVKN